MSQQSSPKRSQDQHSESPIEGKYRQICGFFSWIFVALIANRFSVVINVSSWENTVFFTWFENGVFVFPPLKMGRNPPTHPHVGHSESQSLTEC